MSQSGRQNQSRPEALGRHEKLTPGADLADVKRTLRTIIDEVASFRAEYRGHTHPDEAA